MARLDLVVDVDVVIDGAVDLSATFVIHVDATTLILFSNIATAACKNSTEHAHPAAVTARPPTAASTTKVTLMSKAPSVTKSTATFTSNDLGVWLQQPYTLSRYAAVDIPPAVHTPTTARRLLRRPSSSKVEPR